MVRMIGVGFQRLLVNEVGHQGKVRIAFLHAKITSEAIALDAGDLAGELVKRLLDFGNISRGGFGLPVKEGYVSNHVF